MSTWGQCEQDILWFAVLKFFNFEVYSAFCWAFLGGQFHGIGFKG